MMQGVDAHGQEGSEGMMFWDSHYCDTKNFKRENSAIEKGITKSQNRLHSIL